MNELAPAARASASRRSQPYASKIDAYVIGMSGTSTTARVCASTSRHLPVRIPAASDRSPARRITGPSASGSENGKPELDHVGARLDRRPRELGRLGHRHQVDDERLHSPGSSE